MHGLPVSIVLTGKLSSCMCSTSHVNHLRTENSRFNYSAIHMSTEYDIIILYNHVVETVNSASHFEFKLSERAPCDGDEILVGASRVKGT